MGGNLLRIVSVLLVAVLFLSFALASSQELQLSASVKPMSLEAVAAPSQLSNTVPAIVAASVSVGPMNPAMNLTVGLLLHENLTAAENYISLTNRPDSGFFHKYLTPVEYMTMFGPSNASISLIVRWLHTNGAHDVNVGLDGLVSFVSNVAAIDHLFGVKMNVYSHCGTSYYSNNVNPILPSDISYQVSGIIGLSDAAQIVSSTQNIGGSLSAIPSDVYNFYNAYNTFSAGIYGIGETIGIMGWSGGYANGGFNSGQEIHTSDVNNFWQYYGVGYFDNAYQWVYPYVSQKILGSGGTPPFNSNPGSGSFEMTLDSEWSGTMSPGALITVVIDNAAWWQGQSEFYEWDYELGYMVSTLIPSVVSSSIDFTLNELSGSQMSTVNSQIIQGSAEGITFVSATGDNGFSSSGGLTSISMDPYSIAAGGVNLNLQSNGGISGQSGWYGSGGGYYTGNSIYSQPGYQSGIAPSNGYRDAPDLSFPAWPSIAVYFNGGLVGGWGGTSFAAPMIAGVIADLDQYGGGTYGFINYAIYSMPYSSNAITDVTSGSNGMNAGPGWDYVTGMGTINTWTFVQQVYAYYACNCH